MEKLQAYLLSEPVQQRDRGQGTPGGPAVRPGGPEPSSGPNGALMPARTLNAFKFPAEDVIRQALALYQTSFRKPSFTVYCLDFSPSMRGKGQEQLTQAMRTLLDQQQASRYLLQGAPGDVTIVLTFDREHHQRPEIGAGPSGATTPARSGAAGQDPGPSASETARTSTCRSRVPCRLMRGAGIGDRFPAIILMTDGSRTAARASTRSGARWRRPGLDNVPVFGITFGDADTRQLDADRRPDRRTCLRRHERPGERVSQGQGQQLIGHRVTVLPSDGEVRQWPLWRSDSWASLACSTTVRR